MTKYLTLIFKNLLRSKRRNILTILSIAVSLFIFSVLVSLPTFANQMLADTTSSVRIICRTKMGLAYPLPVAYKPKIAAIPHVVAVAPLVIYGGIYHEVSDQFPSVATEAAQIDMWSDWGSHRRGRVQKDQDRLSGRARHNAPLQSPCWPANPTPGNHISIQCYFDY